MAGKATDDPKRRQNIYFLKGAPVIDRLTAGPVRPCAEESFPIVLLELLVEMVLTNLRVGDQSLLLFTKRTHVLFLSGFDRNAGNVDAMSASFLRKMCWMGSLSHNT